MTLRTRSGNDYTEKFGAIGSLAEDLADRDAVIDALDHARIAEGPGGAAEMVPGQHHLRMNMYIAQSKNGQFEIVKSVGVVDPKEQSVSAVVG